MANRVLKQLGSLILPTVVLVVVPLAIERQLTRGPDGWFAAGLALMLLGLLIMVQTIGMFIRKGKGTLAPWNPPQTLITGGPYAYVRNPMILGVVAVLLGESLAVWTWRIAAWAAFVFALNTIYFALSEEPGLEKRFGEEYRQYRADVRRWIPRLKPYRQNRDRPR